MLMANFLTEKIRPPAATGIRNHGKQSQDR